MRAISTDIGSDIVRKNHEKRAREKGHLKRATEKSEPLSQRQAENRK